MKLNELSYKCNISEDITNENNVIVTVAYTSDKFDFIDGEIRLKINHDISIDIEFIKALGWSVSSDGGKITATSPTYLFGNLNKLHDALSYLMIDGSTLNIRMHVNPPNDKKSILFMLIGLYNFATDYNSSCDFGIDDEWKTIGNTIADVTDGFDEDDGMILSQDDIDHMIELIIKQSSFEISKYFNGFDITCNVPSDSSITSSDIISDLRALFYVINNAEKSKELLLYRSDGTEYMFRKHPKQMTAWVDRSNTE